MALSMFWMDFCFRRTRFKMLIFRHCYKTSIINKQSQQNVEGNTAYSTNLIVAPFFFFSNESRFDFKEVCFICGSSCAVERDKEHPDR